MSENVQRRTRLSTNVVELAYERRYIVGSERMANKAMAPLKDALPEGKGRDFVLSAPYSVIVK